MILLQRKRGRHDLPGRLVVSMETGAAAAMEPLDFAGYRPDRGTELALFALEAKHELRLSHRDGCLKALWQPIGSSSFRVASSGRSGRACSKRCTHWPIRSRGARLDCDRLRLQQPLLAQPLLPVRQHAYCPLGKR